MADSKRIATIVVGVIAAIVVLIVLAYLLGFIQLPSGGIEDIGDWGEVTEERTEVVTTAWVNNPNAFGINLGENLDITYQLYLNEIKLAEGEKEQISIEQGNNTVEISTYIINEELPEWWVAYVKDNETIPVRAEGQAHVDAPIGGTFSLPTQEKVLLENSTPMISAMSSTANSTAGSYTKSVSVGDLNAVTVGYEIERGWATWGEVNESTTTILIHFRFHNPSERIPAPAAPNNFNLDIDVNDVDLLQAEGEDISLRNLPSDAVIEPGEKREIVYVVTMDNEKVDDWFVSHVRNNEVSSLETQIEMSFTIEGTQIDIPGEGVVSYECELQTGILVDNQETRTTCGRGGGVGVGN